MPNTLLSLKQPLEPILLEIVRRVVAAAKQHGLDHFICGAGARDIYFVNALGLSETRGTEDLDFGFAVRDWQCFEQLKQQLITDGFRPDQHVNQRLRFGDELYIDLIPFGAVESPKGTVQFPPDHDFHLNVQGFDDALRSALTIELAPGLLVHVASPVGLLIMKLFAWRDRPKEGSKDAADILYVLRKCGEGWNEEIYSDLDLLELLDGDTELVSARLLGRKIANSASDSTRAGLTTLLHQATAPINDEPLLLSCLTTSIGRLLGTDKVRELIRQLVVGFGESSPRGGGGGASPSEHDDGRKSIFISHANPEDNAFVSWLGGKLAAAGYQVWIDLNEIRGGNLFWEKIEEVIRKTTAIFIAVLSRSYQDKRGCQDELALALTIERQIPNFVIPIRVGSIDFSELRINVHRKHVIDFKTEWDRGLAALLETLAEQGVRRGPDADLSVALPWLVPAATHRVVHHPERLESNWFPIKALPTSITAFDAGNIHGAALDNETKQRLPWFRHANLFATFAREEDVRAITGLRLRASTVLLETFLQGDSTVFTGLNRVQASNKIKDLIQQAWDHKMAALGLKSYPLANRQMVWYLPNKLVEKNKIAFIDADGRTRRKNLVGRSEKYKVFWHYGVSMRPVLGEKQRIEVFAHIIFSEDGVNPIDSLKRMHRLRRAFCRNWWNDVWRSLLRAFMAFASAGGETIALDVGTSNAVVISAAGLTFESPISIQEAAVLDADAEIVVDDSVDVDAPDPLISETDASDSEVIEDSSDAEAVVVIGGEDRVA